jgi:outer membrane protein assembly factor BamA
MPDREYSKARLNQLVQRQLLPVYYARGYLKATFGDPQPKMVKEPGAESDEEGARNQSVVDVTFAVSPGQQYKLKSLDWAGNHELTTETLQKMVHAEPGKPANTVRLGDDIKAIQTLYGSRGFLKATINPEARFDDASGTVILHMDVKEDSVYHMGELEFRGLDNSLTAKLRSVWKIRAGEVYDATYLSDYLPQAQKLLPANLDWEVSPHVTANIREKTVDVDLIYSVKAPK